MDLRRWTGVEFVARAPTRAGGEVDLRVSRMLPEHVLWWHSHVQPLIDADPARPDRGWNWLLYAPFSQIAGGLLARAPAGYCVGIEVREEGHFIPCALAQLLGRYPALNNHRVRSTFTWFLTTAPKSALVSIPEYHMNEDRLPGRLGTITLDVAVTHSLNHRGRGRVGLHADEEGGEDLLSWYRKNGMNVLSAENRLPRGPRRLVSPSDGRYCYFTAKDALTFSRSLDHLR